MNDLTTLPSSVRYQLERAHEYAENGQMQAAERTVRDAVVTLASTNPELCGLLIALHLGYTDLTLTHTDEQTETTRTSKYAFGIRYGEDVVTVTKSKTTTKRLGVSGPGRR